MPRISAFHSHVPMDNANAILNSMARSLLPKTASGRYTWTVSLPKAGRGPVVGLAGSESWPGASGIEKTRRKADDSDILTVLDGALHNRLDLARELGLAGSFHTAAMDEKLLAEGYRRQGIDFFRRINGEFSFVLYDQMNDRLYAVRDRFGTHPLFMVTNGEKLAIATEIKSLFAHPAFQASPNLSLIRRYLFSNYRYAYGTEETFFEGVRLLPPNTIWFLEGKTARDEPLWPFEVDDLSKISDEDAVEQFHSLLEHSFRLRLDPIDKPYGFLLSGGLDSPTIATLAALRSGNSVTSYSICFKNENTPDGELRFDERKLIRPTVEKYGMDWQPVFPSPEDFETVFEEMIVRHDEPISSPTWFAHYQLVRYIAESGIAMVFGGDGGDHVLAGLYDDFPYYFADLKGAGDDARLEYELDCWQTLHDHPVFRKNRDIWNTYVEDCFDWSHPGRITGYTWDDERLRGFNRYDNVIHDSFRDVPDHLPTYPSVSNRYLISKLWQDLMYSSSPPSTRAEDINLASFGVSLRSIFLDSQFAQFCWGLPGHLMIRDGHAKYLIRRAMEGKLAEPVRTNTNHVGLNAPANLWFRGPLKGLIEDTVKSDIWSGFTVFNSQCLEEILAEHLNQKEDHMMFLWKIFSLERWLRHWRFV